MILAASLALAAFFAPSAASASSFELYAPTGPVLIGAPFMLEGTATYPERYILSFDPAAVDATTFTVTAADLGDPRAHDGVRTQSVRIKAAGFQLGAATFPPIAWALRDASSGSTDTLKSPPVRLELVAPKEAPGEEQDIRDIRGPLGMFWLFAGMALLAAAAAGGAWYAWRRWRKRGSPEGEAEAPVDTRAPHEIALDALRRLHEMELPVKEFYGRMTDILRAYYERRFGIAALVLTTGDLVRQMRKADVERDVIARSKTLFERGDLAKFAKFIPETEDIRRDWETAVGLVEDTAPKPPPEPNPMDAAGTEPPK